MSHTWISDLEQATAGTVIYLNVNKSNFICLKKRKPYPHSNQNPKCMAQRKQQEALVSTLMPTKLISCVLNKWEPSPHYVANL